MEDLLNDILLDHRDAMDELTSVALSFEEDEQVQAKLAVVAAAVTDGLTKEEVESIEAAGFKLTNDLVSLDDFRDNRNGFNLVLAGEGLADLAKSALKAPFLIIGGIIAAVAALIYRFATWIFKSDKSGAALPVKAVDKLEKVNPTPKSSGKEAPTFFATIKPVNQEAAFKKWVELAVDYAQFRSYVIPGEEKDFTDFTRPVTPHRIVDIGTAAEVALDQIILLSDALTKTSPEQILKGGGDPISTLKETVKNCDDIIKQASGPMNFDDSASNDDIRKQLQSNLANIDTTCKELATDLSWVYRKKDVASQVALMARDYDSFKRGGYEKLLGILRPFKSDAAVKKAKSRKEAIAKAFDKLDKVEGLKPETANELKSVIKEVIDRINVLQAIINSTVSLVGKVNIKFNPKSAYKGTSVLSNYVDEITNERGEMIGWNEYPIVINDRGEVDKAKLEENRNAKGVAVNSK